nr:unnamed protein product [Callosobruchus analis]
MLPVGFTMTIPDILNKDDFCFVPVYLHDCLASTPSLECESEQTHNTERRNSSGTLLSPEVDAGGETDGFYLLKKDSQRRTTLSKVLANDGAKICDVWMQKVRDKYHGETVLTERHLKRLMDSLKSYLIEQSMGVVETTITQLRLELDFDAAAINQLQFAIYLFQESVIEVLRLHPIKPHWMFALDNLVRQCVQAAVTVLTPELVEHIANHSSPSTVTSTKSSSGKISETYDVQVLHHKSETGRVRQELLDSLREYQHTVKQLAEEFRQQTEVLKQICSSNRQREVVEEDTLLNNWLEGLGIHSSARKILVGEGYTLEEVLYHIGKEELRLAGLRGASVFRIWRAIENHRKGVVVVCNGVTTDETGTI